MQTYTHCDTVESAVRSAHRLAAKIVHTHTLSEQWQGSIR
eukprot:COSAG01_NODE_40515_length_462_cov_5.898072_1_plen_39_part_10